MISPLLARSLAALTMRICASSTSLSRTGPRASISSRTIFLARSLMLEKKPSLNESVAPFSERASLSFSIGRSSDRAGKILREDMEALGPVRLKDVDEAQMRMVNAAKDLANKGEIMIASKQEDDELIY